MKLPASVIDAGLAATDPCRMCLAGHNSASKDRCVHCRNDVRRVIAAAFAASDPSTEYAVAFGLGTRRQLIRHSTDRRNVEMVARDIAPQQQPMIMQRPVWRGTWTEAE